MQENLIGTIPNPPRTDFSISFVINLFSMPSEQATILRFTNRESYTDLTYYGDRAPFFHFDQNQSYIAVTQGSTENGNHFFRSGVSLTLNETHFVKVEYIQNEISLYINDKFENSMSIPIYNRPQLD